METFKNQYGEIKVGTLVSFMVENQSDWGGDLQGVLQFDTDINEFVVDTKRSGRLKIGHYLSVYPNTIKPI